MSCRVRRRRRGQGRSRTIALKQMRAGKKIAFRADGSKSIGFGHIVRSCVLASALEERGYETVFITSGTDETASGYITRRGFSLRRIPDEVNQNPAEQHVEFMRDCGARITVLDSYRVDDAYRARLKQNNIIVVAIDDVYSHYSHADLVINHNPSADARRYADFSGMLLPGAKYALIDPRFARSVRREPTAAAAPKLLVTMGGSDARDQTWRIVGILDTLEEDFSITVAAGFYEMTAPKHYRREPELVRSSDNMASVIAGCDAAITAGGVTCMELACVGIPFLVFVTDPFQKDNARVYHEKGAGIFKGELRELSDDELCTSFMEFLSIKKEWQVMGSAGRQLVDGHGAQNCAEAIDRFLKDSS